MSVLIGAARIQDKHGTDYRLKVRRGFDQRRPYRFAFANGWSCQHWHRTPEDALACAIAKGAPMA